MNRLFLLAFVLMAAPLMMAEDCTAPSATEAEAQGVARQDAQYLAAQPVPFYNYSPERDYLTQLYNLRQSNVTTHSVWRSYDGTLLFDCPSMGFGIPYDLQLTNPLKIAEYGSHAGYAIVEQAEPNGLFSSKNTSATWVLCVEDDGGLAPVYVEAVVNVYPWPMNVNYETGVVKPTGKTKVRLKKAEK
mgnify:CR=1 FL=1|jgi:hypothetical protein